MRRHGWVSGCLHHQVSKDCPTCTSSTRAGQAQWPGIIGVTSTAHSYLPRTAWQRWSSSRGAGTLRRSRRSMRSCRYGGGSLRLVDIHRSKGAWNIDCNGLPEVTRLRESWRHELCHWFVKRSRIHTAWNTPRRSDVTELRETTAARTGYTSSTLLYTPLFQKKTLKVFDKYHDDWNTHIAMHLPRLL